MTRRNRLLALICATLFTAWLPTFWPGGLGWVLMVLLLFAGVTHDRLILAWLDAGESDDDSHSGPPDVGGGQF